MTAHHEHAPHDGPDNSAPPDGFEREELAIIGMSGRFPGAADVDELWQLVLAGGQAMHDVPLDALRALGVPEDRAADPRYVAVVSALDHADCFDAEFFGLSRREAEIMDPQHRILLECAWGALEHAGYDPATVDGRIGVFGGVAQNSYLRQVLSTRPDIMEQFAGYPLLIGSEREYAITRIAFQLDLRGPAISVNTACSTSGVALHLAGQSLLAGECDVALVGGARIQAPLGVGYRYEPDGILSPDGRCRPFDAAAAGTIAASGAAMLALKRLSDAERDGDTVHGVVRGTAVNNDGGDKAGFTAPGHQGQIDVIGEALAVAEVDAGSISYVEAHGTGTHLGDPIEVAALTAAFGADGTGPDRCVLGSVKSNIGHLDAAAGVAGIIKTVMAMRHHVLPPTANFVVPNPEIDFDAGPFVVTDQPEHWPATDRPRRAGVSSFGLGGTNSHVILEEPPPGDSMPTTREHHLVTLSARTPEALDAAAHRLADHLDGPAGPDRLADVAHTLAVGRRA
ncbi:MAG: polyketide synthase, partial [Actinomycetota bacterium]